MQRKATTHGDFFKSALFHKFPQIKNAGLKIIRSDAGICVRVPRIRNEKRQLIRSKLMASNKSLVPEAKEALSRFKMEAANEVGVNLKQGYNGDLTSKQAGSVGGQMVKKMIESYENSIKTR